MKRHGSILSAVLKGFGKRTGLLLGHEPISLVDLLEVSAMVPALPLGISAWAVLAWRGLRHGNTKRSKRADTAAAERTATLADKGVQNKLRRTAHRIAKRELERLVSATAARTWLDIATGAGDFLSVLPDFKGKRIGLDLYRFSAGSMARWSPGSTFVQGDARALPFKSRSIDLVTCLFFLHHLYDPLPALSEAKRVMSQKGCLLLFTVSPIFGYRLLLNLGLSVVSPSGDVRMYAPRQVRNMIELAGLQVEKSRNLPLFASFVCRRAE